MVFSVRDRLDFARPVMAANSSSDSGERRAMVASSSRFPAESTLANDSVHVNQTLGSSAEIRLALRLQGSLLQASLQSFKSLTNIKSVTDGGEHGGHDHPQH